MAARFEFRRREAVLAVELKRNRTEGGFEAWGRFHQPTDQVRRRLEHPVEQSVIGYFTPIISEKQHGEPAKLLVMAA
jgi:hypothetical protein